MTSRCPALLVAALLAGAAQVALGEDLSRANGTSGPEDAVTPTVSADPVVHWAQQLDQAAKRVTVAEANLAAAKDAYQDWRQRKYPRGKRKGEVVGKIEEAETELHDAWAAFPEVYETARRVGVPNAVLRRYDARLRTPPAELAN